MSRQGNYFGDEAWIEFLEGELDGSLSEDMERLLKNSKADREILESYRAVKALLLESDDMCSSEDDRAFDRLHDRIMGSLDVPARPVETKFKRRRLRPVFVGTTLFSFLLVALCVFTIASRRATGPGPRLVNVASASFDWTLAVSNSGAKIKPNP